MKKKRDVFNVKLDHEEQELLKSVERSEWKTVDNAEEEAAANSLRKDERITLRLLSVDLDRLK